jgi:multiple sugar transport system permease protein
MTAVTLAGSRPATRHDRARRRFMRACLYLFLTLLAFVFMWPLFYAVYMSLRPFGDIVINPAGPFSLPNHLNLDNYTYVLDNYNFLGYYWNTAVITIPAVILTLWISSMVAFAISKYSWKFNLLVLMVFTAGNLLPAQVIIVPLFRVYLSVHLPLPSLPIPAIIPPLSDNGLLYDQFIGLILIHTTFQAGFCTFVLSNYMKTLPKELVEAAVVDGASVWTTYRSVIMPLCTPALAALSTLLFTWIYNDFFWALMLFKTGDKRPITAALNNLSGQFFSDPTQVAAASVMAAIPTVLVYVVLQRWFVRGLTLGSAKG